MTVKIIESGRSIEESYTAVIYDILNDGVNVGDVSIVSDDDGIYIERIDIDDNRQNNGYGTEAIRIISNMSGNVYAAPDNEDSRGLFERIGRKVFIDGIDQGYGVYRV